MLISYRNSHWSMCVFDLSNEENVKSRLLFPKFRNQKLEKQPRSESLPSTLVNKSASMVHSLLTLVTRMQISPLSPILD